MRRSQSLCLHIVLSCMFFCVAVLPAVAAPPGIGSARAYIPNHDSNSITVLDPASGSTSTISGTIDSPFSTAVSPDGTRVYIAGYSYSGVSDGINVLDTGTNALSILPLTSGYNFMGIAISPDGKKLYAARKNENDILVINVADGSNVSIGGFNFPGGVAVAPDNSKVYVSDYGNNKVKAIATSGHTVTEIAGGSFEGPWGIAVSPDGSAVYVANETGTTISVINAATNMVTDAIPVGSHVSAVAVSPNGATIYAGYAAQGGTDIFVIDTASKTVVSSIPVNETAEGISITPDGVRVVAANFSASTATIINTAGNLVENTVATGSAPRAFGNFIAAPPAVTNGLVSLWRGEWNVFDVVGGNNASWGGMPAYDTGVNGSAFKFNGMDNYVNAGTGAAFNFNGGADDFTLQAWIKLDSMPVFASAIMGKATHGPENIFSGPYSGWAFYIYSDGRLAFGGAGVWEFTSSPNTIIAGNWHHVVVTKTAGTYKLYSNGQEVASANHGNLEASAAPLLIGTSYIDALFFNGLIDEAAIYNRSLSQLEVSALYSGSDITPDFFYFMPLVGAALKTPYVSPDIVTVSGITSASPISVTGGEYAVSTDGGLNWGEWTGLPGTVSPNNQVKLRLTSSAAMITRTEAVLTIGGVSAPFSVTTVGKPGDCDFNGTVSIAEVQSAINMFLGLKQAAICVDVDNNSSVSISEVQKAINSFLGL